MKMFSIKTAINCEAEYDDSEINLIIDTIIRNELGGYASDSNYLLNKTFKEKKEEKEEEYIVAVIPAINSNGLSFKKKFGTNDDKGVSSLNIEYFFDKSSHENLDELKNIIQEILKANTNEEVINIVNKYKDSGNKMETVTEVINESEGNLENLKKLLNEKSKEIDAVNKDVFDEIPFKINENFHAKILFPYNISDIHWLTAEIKIHKNKASYGIELLVHDPYGDGKLDPQFSSQLKKVLEKRINEIDGDGDKGSKKTTVSKKKKREKLSIIELDSPYPARQAKDDNKSCGVIMVSDLVKRIKGEELNEIYPKGAKKLREKHIEILRKYLKPDDKNLVNFIDKVTLKKNDTETSNSAKDELNQIKDKLKVKSEDPKSIYEEIQEIANKLNQKITEVNKTADRGIELIKKEYQDLEEKLHSSETDSKKRFDKTGKLAFQMQNEVADVTNNRDFQLSELKQQANQMAMKKISKLIDAALQEQINDADIKAKRTRAVISFITAATLAAVTAAKEIARTLTNDSTSTTILDALSTVIAAISAAAITYIGVNLRQEAKDDEKKQKKELTQTQGGEPSTWKASGPEKTPSANEADLDMTEKGQSQPFSLSVF